MEWTTRFVLCIAAVTFAFTIDAKTIPKASKETKESHDADIGKLFKALPKNTSPLAQHLETVIKKRLHENPHAVKQALLLASKGLKKKSIPHKKQPDIPAAHRSQKIGYKILDRVYWKDSVETLYGRIFMYAHRNKGGSNPGEELQKRYLEKLVKNDLKHFKSFLKNLTDKQLKELFWKVQEAIKRGDITPDGKVIIDGKKYDLKELASYCCPFG